MRARWRAQKLSRATTTPSLHKIGADWFMIFALSGQNILLQKSTSGKPEGPYDDYSLLATRGGFPTLVQDGGAVYLVFAEGWIGKLKSDLKGLDAPPKPLALAPAASPGESPLFAGDRGVAVFQRGGKFHLLAARWAVRDGKPSHDATLWVADAIEGPYRKTDVVLADTGPVSVFQDAKGEWQAIPARPLENSAPAPLPIPNSK